MAIVSVQTIHLKDLTGYFIDAAAMAQHAAHHMPASCHNTQQQLLKQRDQLETAAALIESGECILRFNGPYLEFLMDGAKK